MQGRASSVEQYRQTIENDEALTLFMASVGEFDRAFCDSMASGEEFTIKLEVHGNRGELIHVRVQDDAFRRPCGVERRVEKKSAKRAR